MDVILLDVALESRPSSSFCAAIICSISDCSRFCSCSWRESSSCSSICTLSVISCTSRLRCSEHAPCDSICSGIVALRKFSELSPPAPASIGSAGTPGIAPLPAASDASSSSLIAIFDSPPSDECPADAEPPAPPDAPTAAAFFCIRQRYFCRCDLMLALVRPSTFISRRIDLGFALSSPSAFTAASKRECRSVVHTKRRFCCDSPLGSAWCAIGDGPPGPSCDAPA
mmetsp:Transcript_22640/g.55950  ORF Transcript_22640/g.55950 Transcript_22640/m.55950 type:complete len:227 (+) Transcript_22640:995-1675(+)